jgi:ABC-2 type transport system permease protein
MTTVPMYDSQTRPAPVVGEFLELLRYRDLLRLLVINNIKTRYKRSMLGVIWTLLNPLLMMMVMTVAFSSLFRSSLEHYAVYVLAGLLFWNFFAQSTTAAMKSLVWGGALIRRIYLPRAIFAVSAIGTGLVNLLLGLIPLGLVMLGLGHPIRPALWFLPVAIGLTAMFALGVALFLSALAVFFADVVEMYEVILRAVFYLSAVMYPASILPANYAWFLHFNPLYNLLEAFRTPIYVGTLAGSHTLWAAAASAGVALVIGWWLFVRQIDEYAYRI